MKHDDGIPIVAPAEVEAKEAERLAAIGPLCGDRPVKPCKGCGADTHGTYCAECRRIRGNAMSAESRRKKRREARA